MKLLVFPLTLGVAIIVGPVLASIVDMVLLGHTDPKFNPWHTTTIVAVFAAICAIPVAISGGLARFLFRTRYPVNSMPKEFLSALLTGAVLVASVCGIIAWEIEIGGLTGLVIALPFVGFLVSGITLVAVQRFSAGDGASKKVPS